jgi:hypothetical protein
MGTLVRILLALAFAYVVIRAGFFVVRTLAVPAGEPPPPGELRRVRLRYRCLQCGMELRVDAATNEDPAPPRHCMDEMELVATADDAL